MCSNFRQTVSNYLDMVVSPDGYYLYPSELLMLAIETADDYCCRNSSEKTLHTDSFSIPEQYADDFRNQVVAYAPRVSGTVAATAGNSLLEAVIAAEKPSAILTVQRMVRAWLVRSLDMPLANPIWLKWNNGVVVRIAREIVEANSWSDCPVLADALEEAGCSHDRILSHLRDDAVKTDCDWCCCVNGLCLSF